jgi:TonB-linked SusC/RagA family outer membrane protein
MRKTMLLTAVVMFVNVAMAQMRSISGKVTDAAGKPVDGASVLVKGSGKGTSADAAGNFVINAATGNVLVVSALNYVSIEVTVGTGNTVNVVLKAAETTSLNEVVVTGYTSFIKKKSAGSTAIVTAEKINNVPLGSFDQILQGQATGLQVTAQSGQPGSSASVQIRGKSSIVGSTTPLYIVDGVQINANDFATLNPGDFENVSVLKDASATALYGSRGGSGVIVVTTKKGKAGKTQVSYDGQYGFSKFPNPRLDVMNTQQKLDYELNSNNPYGPNPYDWTPAEIEALRKINTNWQDVLFQTGKTSSHQVSASGGTDKTRFYLSAAIFDQTGIVKYTELNRYTLRFNIDNTIGDFRFGINSQFGYSKLNNTQENDEFIGSPLNAIRWANPYEKPFNDDGSYTEIVSGQPNPLQEIEQNKRKNNQTKAVGNVYMEYKFPFLQGLSARTSWGGDYTQDEANVYLAPQTYQGSIAQGGTGSLTRGISKVFRYTGTTSLTYTTRFATDHELTASAFYEIVKTNITSFGYTGFGLTLPYTNEFSITPGNATNGFIPTVNGNGQINALISYFADVNYGYKGKYYLNANLRRDGSSRFGSNNRYATFASVGASWMVSDEAFMDGTKGWLNNLRLKASFGSSGNQEGIGNYQARTLFTRTTYDGNSYYLYDQYGNADLQWEAKQTLNVGIDFAVFSNRLRGTIEVYNATTKNPFVDRRISLTTGSPSYNANVGSLENRGIEVSLNGTVIKAKDFMWDMGINFTYNRNRVKDLYAGKTEQINGFTITKVGQPINTWYLVEVAGVDPQTGEQLYRKADKSVTNEYDPNDRVVLGTSDAPYFGGYTNSFNYKGLELSVLFTYAWGNYLFNNDRQNLENPGYLYDNLSVNMLREWRNPGDITDIPDPNNPYRYETTRFLEKGDFIRLRNITLGYTLPKSVMDKIKLRSIRVFAQGQNLWTKTDFQGYDPEVSSGVLRGAQYPALRTITFGLNIGF